LGSDIVTEKLGGTRRFAKRQTIKRMIDRIFGACLVKRWREHYSSYIRFRKFKVSVNGAVVAVRNNCSSSYK
jgi:hypothetical protein